MVLVKDFARFAEVEVVFAVFVPRQIYKEFQVVELHGVVGCHGVGALQFFQLFVEEICGFLAPFLLGGALFQRFHILLRRGSAQFFLDGFHLLVQEILTLLLVHLLARLVLNLVFQFHHLQVAVQQFVHLLSALNDIFDFQNALFLLH